MNIAVISDIHSNLPALRTALDFIDRHDVDAVYCLGDIVGYGADPAACVDLVRERCAGVVRGNHDEAVALERGLNRLPRDGREAALHNQSRLSPEQLEYLGSLPLTLEVSGCTFVHATPDAPDAWHRLGSFLSAQQQFKHFSTDVCFMGHTHIPAVLSNRLGVLNVRPGNRYLINPGSLGQPRDQDPRLSLGLFQVEEMRYEMVRLPYDVETAAARILEEKLPAALAERLRSGR